MSAAKSRIKLVYLEWVDSSSFNGWNKLGDIRENYFPDPCVSIGFVIKETRDVITLTGSYCHTGDDPADGEAIKDVIGSISIPKVAITKRKLIRLGL